MLFYCVIYFNLQLKLYATQLWYDHCRFYVIYFIVNLLQYQWNPMKVYCKCKCKNYAIYVTFYMANKTFLTFLNILSKQNISHFFFKTFFLNKTFLTFLNIISKQNIFAFSTGGVCYENVFIKHPVSII